MRTSRAAALLSIGVLLLSSTPAFAAKGSHEQIRFDETFDEVLCGIPVTTHVVVTGPINVTSKGRITDNTNVRVTYANADGDWLKNHITGQFREVVKDNGDGTITVVQTNRGTHERLVSADGIEAGFDRGQIVFRIVIDLNDPADEDDDEVVSFEVTKQAGPHPDADAGFAVFCEVVERVLG